MCVQKYNDARKTTQKVFVSDKTVSQSEILCEKMHLVATLIDESNVGLMLVSQSNLSGPSQAY